MLLTPVTTRAPQIVPELFHEENRSLLVIWLIRIYPDEFDRGCRSFYPKFPMRPVFDHTVISNGTNQTILSPFSKKTEWYSPVTIERAIQYPRWINIVKKKNLFLMIKIRIFSKESLVVQILVNGSLKKKKNWHTHTHTQFIPAITSPVTEGKVS